MKFDRSFPGQILLALVALVAIGAYPLVKLGSSNLVQAAVVGGMLATVNVLLGYATIEYSFRKSTTTFLKFVLGGMGLRLLFMGGLIVLLIEVFHVHIAGLVGSLLVCYATFLVLEILFIQKKIEIKQH